MNTCGTCDHYFEGQRRVGEFLPRGWSSCMNPDRSITRCLRQASSKPLKAGCWTRAREQQTIFGQEGVRHG